MLYALVTVILLALSAPFSLGSSPSGSATCSTSAGQMPCCRTAVQNCPMGVSDIGWAWSSQLSEYLPYSYSSMGFKSWTNFTSLSMNQSLSLQLNVMFSTFWVQNTLNIRKSSNGFLIGAVDNIWNSTTGNAMMDGSYSSNQFGQCKGLQASGQLYVCETEKNFFVSLPFEILLTIRDQNCSGFVLQYKIFHANKIVKGIKDNGFYDGLCFDSKPKGYFQIGGFAPSGLANDAENILGGPGGGRNTVISKIQMKMGLYELPIDGIKFLSVAHAWSSGVDTGESVSNVYMSGNSNQIAKGSIGHEAWIQLW